MAWSLWQWPFFEEKHHALAQRLGALELDDSDHGSDLASYSRRLNFAMGAQGLLEVAVPREGVAIDLRSACIAREALAYRNVLADTLFAMQGIGTAPIAIHGTPAQRSRYMDGARSGERIAAFALTEPQGGSDVAAVATTAQRDGDGYVLNGEKAWISNAGIADHYVVVARTGEAPGSRGLSAFIVEAGTPGFEPTPMLDMVAPHPIAGILIRNCRLDASALLGEAGHGFKIAMGTFDIFRASVGAAALGIARRALDETMRRVTTRQLFGKPMADLQGVQMKLADMAVDVDTAALAVYRAAWVKDVQGGRATREVSMAKLVGTEAAFRVVDSAVQLFGGTGLMKGCVIEKLYREVRPLRIYEGASEVQKLIIARNLVAEMATVD
jgi:acyl-CoA dehydrogenase